MTISLSDAGKRFNRDWIFRHFTYRFESGNSYAIIGPNGSGKSTLLQTIGGSMALSEGTVEAKPGTALSSAPYQEKVDTEQLYRLMSIAAPYLEVIEEMTVTEFLSFHHSFKPLLPGLSIKEIVDQIGLGAAAGKQIRYYSSGMKQRVKLAQAIFSDTPLLLLDEPCTNLDTTGIALYQQLVSAYTANRIVVVSSNDTVEYGFCTAQISINAYK